MNRRTVLGGVIVLFCLVATWCVAYTIGRNEVKITGLPTALQGQHLESRVSAQKSVVAALQGQTTSMVSTPAITNPAIFAIVNQERNKAGVPALVDNKQLDDAALTKCKDMATRGYWGHTTPEGTGPWKFIDDQGYIYLSAAENLAYGYTHTSEVIAGWLDSPDHRDNLLNRVYTETGLGVCPATNYQGLKNTFIVVQLFGAPR